MTQLRCAKSLQLLCDALAHIAAVRFRIAQETFRQVLMRLRQLDEIVLEPQLRVDFGPVVGGSNEG